MKIVLSKPYDEVLMKGFIYFAMIFIFTSCGSSEHIKIARKANGPKQLYVSLSGDSLGIALDLKEFLKKNGYKVVMRLDEGIHDLITPSSNGAVVIKNATSTRNRYELLLNVDTLQGRFISINALIRDRKESELIATFSWKWNKLLPAPTMEKGLEMINEKLLKPLFE